MAHAPQQAVIDGIARPIVDRKVSLPARLITLALAFMVLALVFAAGVYSGTSANYYVAVSHLPDPAKSWLLQVDRSRPRPGVYIPTVMTKVLQCQTRHEMATARTLKQLVERIGELRDAQPDKTLVEGAADITTKVFQGTCR